MKKTMVMMAAWMLMAGGAMACAQQPEKKDAPETTEAPAPATAADGQESEAAPTNTPDSTAAGTAEEQKTESAVTGEGSSSPAPENPDAPAK